MARLDRCVVQLHADVDRAHLGQARRHERRAQATGHAHPPHQVVAAGGVQDGRRGRCGDLGEQTDRRDAPVDARVVLLHVGVRHCVVEQRLQGTGAERASETPQHEAHGKGRITGDGDPQDVAGGLEYASRNQRTATAPVIGKGARRHLGHDADHGPDDEQGRDLGTGQPGIGEEQRVQRVDRDRVGQCGPPDRQPGKPANLRRQCRSMSLHEAMILTCSADAPGNYAARPRPCGTLHP